MAVDPQHRYSKEAERANYNTFCDKTLFDLVYTEIV